MHYQKDNLLTPNFQYDITKPPLTPGHQYAVRVTAYDPTENIQFKNGGRSPVSTFLYKSQEVVILNPPVDDDLEIINNNPDVQVVDINLNDFPLQNPPPPNEDPPEDLGDCVASCQIPVPQGSPSSINQNQPVIVGMFEMNITQLNGNSGTGTIFIDFLQTSVETTFSGLQVNQSNVMLSGQVYAKVDANSVVSQAIAQNENADLQQAYTELPNLLNEVHSNAKKVSLFDGNQPPVRIPFSLDREGFDMAIVGLIFKETAAYMNVVMGLETLPGSLNPYFGLGQSGIGIRPNGFCADVDLKVNLPQDREVDVVNNGGEDWIKMKFKGSGNGNKTYAKFNCQGVSEVKIDAELAFGKDYLIPVNNNGGEVNGNVKFGIQTQLNDNFNEYMVESPSVLPTGHFTLPALQGFVLTANQLVYDKHSNLESPNMQLHPQHPAAGGNSKLWKGLYIKELSVKFPEGFKKDNNDLSINVTDMLLDKTGFWGEVSVNNLININNGDLGGWAFSIDNFNLDIQESTLAGGGFSGDIELPIADYGIPYSIALSEEQNGNSYQFGISPNTDININMWIAQMTIGNSSSINITKQGNQFKPGATLHGDLTIGWNPDNLNDWDLDNQPVVKKFQLPTLSIEGMQISTNNQNQPKIDDFGLPNLDNINLPQGEFFAFKINLNDINIVNDGNGDNGLQINLGLGFDNSGNEDGDPLISGNGVFTLYPKVVNKKFKFDKTTLNEIGIAASVGPAEINGGLSLFNNDGTYGDGFRGYVSVSMPPIGIEEMAFTLQVGTAPEQYRYWMFDASVNLEFGVPCGPGVAIYGLGGGAWFNMTRSGNENSQDNPNVNVNNIGENVDQNNIDMTPGGTNNGFTYTPEQGTFGFKANVVLGLVGNKSAFNADVGLTMELNQYFGFNFVEFHGKAYLMQNPANRGESLVSGSVLVSIETKNINPNGPVMTADVQVNINVETLKAVEIEANLSMGIMFSPTDWHVYFGSWDTNADPLNYEPQNDEYRNRLAITIPVINVDVGFNCYFMVGTDLPPGLPPLPKNVQSFFPNGSKAVPGMEGITSSGNGFALGAGIHLDVELKFAILYADILFDMGFDALVQKLEGDCGDGQTVGIDGWFAKGQAYAYCHVAGGLEIDLWFFSGKAEFASFTAGALLQMQGPNPTWINGRIKFQVSILGGLVKVNTQFVAEVGEKCDPGAGNPFDDIPIIAYVDPAENAKKVHCYTDPQLIFNFPKEPFKYEVINEEGDDFEERGYSIKVNSVEYWYFDENNKKVDIELNGPYYATDGYSCRYIPEDVFPGVTDIHYKINAQGFEHYMNGYLITDQIKTAFEPQITEGKFQTDSLPDVILVKNIVYSIPGLGQRFFLKNEEPMGEMKLGQQGCPSLFKTENVDNPDEMYVYVAKFKELATNKEYETSCQCNNKLVTYGFPNELKNSGIYRLDFVRRSVPKNNNQVDLQSEENWRKLGDWGPDIGQNIALPLNYGQGNGGGGGNPNQFNLNNIQIPDENPNPNLNNIIINPNLNNNNIQNIVLNANLNNNNNNNPNNMILQNIQLPDDDDNQMWNPDLDLQNNQPQKMIAMEAYDRAFVESVVTVKPVEKILFTNWFKTSKYNTKNEKLAQMVVMPETYSTTYPVAPAHFEGFNHYSKPDDVELEVPLWLLRTEEGLDVYDVKGYFYSDIPPQLLEGYNNQNDLYNVHPPVFQMEYANEGSWLENTFYEPNDVDPKSVFHEPMDGEDYRWMEIWDPTNNENPVPYQFNNPGDLRQFIYYPDTWAQHYPTYFEEEETDDLGNQFWGGDRFRNLSYYEDLDGGPSPIKYRKPFAGNVFTYVDQVIPGPQRIRQDQNFVPSEWYDVNRHGPVDFGGKSISKIWGILNSADINAEKAKAPQEGNNGGNGMGFNANIIVNNNNNNNNGFGNFNFQADPTTFIPVINFSEWMAKRDQIRMANYILWEFREEVCTGCGQNPGTVLNVMDGGGQQYNPLDDPDYGDYDPDQIPVVNPNYAPYTFKYLPLRAWLLRHKRYQTRPAGTYFLKVGNRTFQFNHPAMNNGSWPEDID